MRPKLAILVLLVLTSGCAGVRVDRPNAGERREVAAGAAFTRRACAGCHATGPEGPSPNPHSPPFRTLADRLPGAALEARLGAIAKQGHVEMPPIYMTPGEIAAAAAYIRSLRVPQAALREST
jgi:mono/diheme cytochrome c family protein